jgi:hypothetical protein
MTLNGQGACLFHKADALKVSPDAELDAAALNSDDARRAIGGQFRSRGLHSSPAEHVPRVLCAPINFPLASR